MRRHDTMHRAEAQECGSVKERPSPRRGAARSSSCVWSVCLLCAWLLLCVHSVWRTRNRATVVDSSHGRFGSPGFAEPVRYRVDVKDLALLNLFGPEVTLRTDSSSGACAEWAGANLSVIQAAWQARWLSPGSRGQDNQPVSSDTDRLLACCHPALSTEKAMGGVPLSVDVVYTFVNGSAPTFLARWNQVASRRVLKSTPSSSSALHSDEGTADDDTSAIRDRLRASAMYREHFQENRYRDLGELRHSLLSVANCVLPRSCRRSGVCPDSTAGEAVTNSARLPLSGVVHVVVGHPVEDRPSFLDDATFRSEVAQRIGRKGEALDIRVVSHNQLIKRASDGNNTGDTKTAATEEFFNSNAIETFLHRIPNLSETFLYFNNDMLWGRCPDWADYFVPVAMHNSGTSRVVLQLAPLVFGETPQQQSTRTPTSEKLQRTAVMLAAQAPTFARPQFVTRDGSAVGTPRCERRKCLFESDTSHRDPRHFVPPTEAFSFAHLPRWFTKATLQYLLDRTPDLAPVVRATRSNRLARSPEDLWVPLTFDWFLWDSLRTLLPAHSVSPCVCPLHATSCTASHSHRRNGVCLALAIRGHPNYAFYMVDSAYRARQYQEEVHSRRTMPLFVTVNDDAAPAYENAAALLSVNHHRRVSPANNGQDSLRQAVGSFLSALTRHNASS